MFLFFLIIDDYVSFMAQLGNLVSFVRLVVSLFLFREFAFMYALEFALGIAFEIALRSAL